MGVSKGLSRGILGVQTMAHMVCMEDEGCTASFAQFGSGILLALKVFLHAVFEICLILWAFP